jgi:hypothetical protein
LASAITWNRSSALTAACPDHGLDGAAVDSALGQFGGLNADSVLESAFVFIVVAPFFVVNGSWTR